MYFINDYIPYPSVFANSFIFYMISNVNYDVLQEYLKTGKVNCEKYSSTLLAYVTCGWACFTVVLNVPPLYIYNHFYQFITFAIWFSVHNYQQKQTKKVAIHLVLLTILTLVLLSFHHFEVGALTSILNIIFIIRSFIAFKRTIEDPKKKPKKEFSRIIGYINIVGFFFCAIQNIEGEILHFPFLQGCVQFASTVASELLVAKHHLYLDSKETKDEGKTKKE